MYEAAWRVEGRERDGPFLALVEHRFASVPIADVLWVSEECSQLLIHPVAKCPLGDQASKWGFAMPKGFGPTWVVKRLDILDERSQPVP